MGQSRIHFAELTRTEIQSLAPQSLLIVPVGATEQHGPHLPTGTDALLVEYLASEAAILAADEIPVLVTPTLAFGMSQHHLPFGATASLQPETLFRLLSDVCGSLAAGGFRHQFIVNGHGGNHDLVMAVAHDLCTRMSVNVASCSWWSVASEVLVKAGAPQYGRVPGHAGAFETSLMLALRPDLVSAPRPHRAEPTEHPLQGNRSGYHADIAGFWQSTDGFTDSPDRGNADRGRDYLTATIRELAQAYIEFARSTIHKRPA